ncbi:hypothetical protein E2C01_073183 [Portunus trituberculatus]|uniref:Uncharacterized protein n=1 Tax=Portunus trituberculatus TaxID=210409 RepID=A0A5B7I9W6_PORTR|nr:hypothetical protein [Portunus trituberculatus]
MTEVHQYVDEDKNMDTHNLQMLVLKANEAFEAASAFTRHTTPDSQHFYIVYNMSSHGNKHVDSPASVVPQPDIGVDIWHTNPSKRAKKTNMQCLSSRVTVYSITIVTTTNLVHRWNDGE